MRKREEFVQEKLNEMTVEELENEFVKVTMI